MRVCLTEAGVHWCKNYDAKHKLNYYDGGNGTIRTVRGGMASVEWDSGNKDQRVDNCLFQYACGSEGMYHLHLVDEVPWHCVPSDSWGFGSATSVDGSRLALRIHNLRNMFCKYDANENGNIEFEEFYTLLRMCGGSVTEAQAAAIFADMDKDGSNAVDFDEFKRALLLSLSDPTLAAATPDPHHTSSLSSSLGSHASRAPSPHAGPGGGESFFSSVLKHSQPNSNRQPTNRG
mmetsp:Transcript_62159/g.166793  ORF Transcript_62159/g.166793 Transcript_62159/m.166793 type:complete len:233 (-) Transcript_62159:15-713(-)